MRCRSRVLQHSPMSPGQVRARAGRGLLPSAPPKPRCCTLRTPGPPPLAAPGVGASLLCLPAPRQWGWPLTGGAGCLCSQCLRPGPPDAVQGGAVGLGAHLDVVPHPWPQVPEDHPGVGLDQPLQERGQAGKRLRPLDPPARSWPLCVPALLPGRLRLPRLWVCGC